MGKTARRVARTLAAGAVAVSVGCVAAAHSQEALAFKHRDYYIVSMGGVMPCTFTNAQGQRLEIYDADPQGKKYKFKDRGDMAYSGHPEWEDGEWTAGYDIPWTDRLVYEQPSGDRSAIGGMQVYDLTMDQGGLFVNLLYAKKMTLTIGDDGQLRLDAPSTGEEGKKAYFSVIFFA